MENNNSNVTLDFFNIYTQGSNKAENLLYIRLMTKLSLPFVILLSLGVVIALVSILANYIVLEALRSVPPRVLRSKYLITNALIIDALLCVLQSAGIISYILASYIPDIDSEVQLCFSPFRLIATTILVYTQCMSSMVLAWDRIFAIASPLRYHLSGYGKTGLYLIIIIVMWGIPFCLILPAAIAPFVSTTYISDEPFCTKLLTAFITKTWNDQVRSFLQLGFGILTFSLYIIMFGLVKNQQLGIKSAISKSEETGKTISLAITYFLVHMSRLCLYLPAPIFFGLLNSGVIKLPRVQYAIINQIVVSLYLLNAVLDPYIFASRIPSIQDNLPFSLKIKSKSKSRSTEKTRSTCAIEQ